MLNNTLGILVTIFLLFSACKDEEPSISSTKELLNFSILKSDNQGKVANDKTPPAAVLIKKAAGINTASGSFLTASSIGLYFL